MSKLKIIIADDIFTNRLLLSEILKDLGYEFFLAKNGKEAVDELQKSDYNLVLMDIEMPVMNGVEATKFIREQLESPKCNVPVVALTAHNPKLFFDDFRNVGFSQLLTKPYSVAKLRELLESYVEI
ncbi:MAG: response regulator [Bacteroidales bacterium]|nr:response regulator [Bacteroidales bacterium]MBN2820171.1 response regulator [Bacteroidales bacterium]